MKKKLLTSPNGAQNFHNLLMHLELTQYKTILRLFLICYSCPFIYQFQDSFTPFLHCTSQSYI